MGQVFHLNMRLQFLVDSSFLPHKRQSRLFTIIGHREVGHVVGWLVWFDTQADNTLRLFTSFHSISSDAVLC